MLAFVVRVNSATPLVPSRPLPRSIPTPPISLRLISLRLLRRRRAAIHLTPIAPTAAFPLVSARNVFKLPLRRRPFFAPRRSLPNGSIISSRHPSRQQQVLPAPRVRFSAIPPAPAISTAPTCISPPSVPVSIVPRWRPSRVPAVSTVRPWSRAGAGSTCRPGRACVAMGVSASFASRALAFGLKVEANFHLLVLLRLAPLVLVVDVPALRPAQTVSLHCVVEAQLRLRIARVAAAAAAVEPPSVCASARIATGAWS